MLFPEPSPTHIFDCDGKCDVMVRGAVAIIFTTSENNHKHASHGHGGAAETTQQILSCKLLGI